MTTLLDRPQQTIDRPVQTVPEVGRRLPPTPARPIRRWPRMVLLVGLLAALVGFGCGFGLGYISRNSEVAQLTSLGTFTTLPSEDLGQGYLPGGSVYDSQIPGYTTDVGQGYLPGSSVYRSQVPPKVDQGVFPTTVTVPHGVAPVDTPEIPPMVKIPHQVAPVDTPEIPVSVIVQIPHQVAPVE